MFQLGFSLVHLGYSLIFSMVLAGFLWDQPIYESERWRVRSFIFEIPEVPLRNHCADCAAISSSVRGIERVLGTRKKLKAYVLAHECDPYDLLLKGIKPPPIFKAVNKDYEDGHSADVYWAIHEVERKFPSRIDTAAPHPPDIFDGCAWCRGVRPFRAETSTEVL